MLKSRSLEPLQRSEDHFENRYTEDDFYRKEDYEAYLSLMESIEKKS